MCDSSEKAKVEEQISSTKEEEDNDEIENQPRNIWSPAFNEFCFGDSPWDVDKKLPKKFNITSYDTLPIADEYQLDRVKYFFIYINKFKDITKFIPSDNYISPSSYICFLFAKEKLFRISIRLIHDERAENYKNIVQSYARAVNTPLLTDGMFHYEDERIFYFSSEQDDHTLIETIEKGHVIPDGHFWNPHPSLNVSQKSSNLSNSKYLYDLMISYSHQDKDICHQIYYKLIEDGFKVWMDFENMYGSTIERMAEAIQNSQFIIICMSHKYQSSPYCKTEGQYTYKLQRPFIPLIVEKGYRPYDWLGAFSGLRMYIDFTKYDFHIAYEKLITEIQRNKLEE